MSHICTAFCDETGHVTEPLYGESRQRLRRLVGKHLDSTYNEPDGCIEVVDVLSAPEAPPPIVEFDYDEVTRLRFRFMPARSVVEQFVHDNPDCPFCLGCGIVCEDHPGRPWDSGTARDCGCGGAGMPCPRVPA